MTDGLSHLPVNPLPNVPRHVYGPDHFVKADPNKGRPYNQTERACPCGVVKITVFGPEGAWREWRLPGSPRSIQRCHGHAAVFVGGEMNGHFSTIAACHVVAIASPREGDSGCVHPRFTSYPQVR